MRESRNQRDFGTWIKNGSVLIVSLQQLHRLIPVFKGDASTTAFQWETQLFPFFSVILRFLNYFQIILRVLLTCDMEAQIFLSKEHLFKLGGENNANWTNFFLFQCGQTEGTGAAPLWYHSDAWLWFHDLKKLSNYLKPEQLLIQGILRHTKIHIKQFFCTVLHMPCQANSRTFRWGSPGHSFVQYFRLLRVNFFGFFSLSFRRGSS